MSIPASTIERLLAISKEELTNRRVLSVGSHNVGFSEIPPIVARTFPEKSSLWDRQIKQLKSHNDHKLLLKDILMTFGFESYSDLDKNPLAELTVDLSDSDSLMRAELELGNYGVVINNGTTDYVADINLGLNFVLSKVAMGGYIISNTDHTSFNRYPTTPSPEFLVDIHDHMGFDCVALKLIDGHGKPFKDYKLNYRNKHNYLFEELNLWRFVLYVLWQIGTYAFAPSQDGFSPSKYHKYKKENFCSLRDSVTKGTKTYSKPKATRFQRFYDALFECLAIIIKPIVPKSYFERLREINLGRSIIGKLTHKSIGRVILYSEFKKTRNKDSDTKLNSSTLYYQVRYPSENDNL